MVGFSKLAGSDEERTLGHLMFYFGMVFVVEGIGQTDGIIAQPLVYYFKEVHSYHMTDTLHFSQGYIGILGAISSAGSICGALIYRRSLAELTSKRLLQLSIVLGTATTASFVLSRS